MQTPDHIANLIFKYLRNELSHGEKIRLKSWREESSKNELIFQRLTDADRIRELLKDYESRKNAWNKIVNLAPELKEVTPVRKLWLKPLSFAAGILLIFGLAFIIRLMIDRPASKSNGPESKLTENKSKDSVAVIQGVTSKAILTLSNGSQISLDSNNRTEIKSLGNNIVEKNGGELLYNNSDAIKTDSEAFNILTTPRGGQFQLSLPDGTLVWLNAASMIKYPIAFNGRERKVEISGEAYFEVNGNAKKPFIVIVGNRRLEVLGTHFNINSYSDEPKTTVALLEGSVRFQNDQEAKLLAPGDLAQVSNASGKQNIELIKNADVASITSWRSGRTLFKDANIQSIMRIVSRWYNLDVAYQGNIPERSITGGVSRNESLPELLKVLDWNNIHYKIKGTQITITQ